MEPWTQRSTETASPRTPLPGVNPFINAIAVQPDGKIVVAGENGSPTNDFLVVRLTTTGALDGSFGVNGYTFTDIASNGFDNASDVLVQPDGKIVLAGTWSDPNSSASQFAIARYNTNGNLDLAFAGTGRRRVAFTNESSCLDVALQSDGKLVMTGDMLFDTNDFDFAVARVNADGTTDNGFDGDGILSTGIGGNDFAGAVAIQSDGKIVVAGGNLPGGTANGEIVRYLTNGALDNSFDGDGKRIITRPHRQPLRVRRRHPARRPDPVSGQQSRSERQPEVRPLPHEPERRARPLARRQWRGPDRLQSSDQRPRTRHRPRTAARRAHPGGRRGQPLLHGASVARRLHRPGRAANDGLPGPLLRPELERAVLRHGDPGRWQDRRRRWTSRAPTSPVATSRWLRMLPDGQLDPILRRRLRSGADDLRFRRGRDRQSRRDPARRQDRGRRHRHQRQQRGLHGRALQSRRHAGRFVRFPRLQHHRLHGRRRLRARHGARA